MTAGVAVFVGLLGPLAAVWVAVRLAQRADERDGVKRDLADENAHGFWVPDHLHPLLVSNPFARARALVGAEGAADARALTAAGFPESLGRSAA